MGMWCAVDDEPFRDLFSKASWHTVYPKKYAHRFVVICFVVVMQSFIMDSHEVFSHIHQGCFAGTGAIVILPQCQWSEPDGYGKISQCITTTKHSKLKQKPRAYFLGYTVEREVYIRKMSFVHSCLKYHKALLNSLWAFLYTRPCMAFESHLISYA